ncbi:uncharacterized protein LOC126992944 [Eriocheir sinensis]|uniref:uncharacterized protein LOC126992944 n=1 Tax=Eriocheir sinensis TaxID=95602 RepID=UPI0021C75D5A|nr:uncharacterized protein LOC126992944 [Eriocheir sinensis]
MSECGACGRRWVEPRLLPCLHTICTPCLHARATQVTPPATYTTVSTTTATRTQQATPTPGSRCGSRASQEQEVTALSCTSTAAPSPSLAPDGDSLGHASPLCNGNVTTATTAAATRSSGGGGAGQAQLGCKLEATQGLGESHGKCLVPVCMCGCP